MRIYRASGLGYSLCQLVCPHLGYQAVSPPDWLQEAYDRGRELEEVVIKELRECGWDIETEQEEINAVGDRQIEVDLEVIPGQAMVRGHLDGRTPNAVVEIKTMSHQNFLDWKTNGWDSKSKLIEKYKWQASAYLLATGLPAHLLVGWDKETSESHVWEITEPFFGISDIAYKLAQAEEHIRLNSIPDGCTDFPCPFFYLHENKDAVETVDADAQLDSLMTAWLEADRKKKVYEGEAGALRDMIVEMLGDREAGKIKGSQGVTVNTRWQDASEGVWKKKAGWVTSVSAPRKKVGDGEI